jgi:hypothetical protein
MHDTPFAPMTPPPRPTLEMRDASKALAERVPELGDAMWAVTNEQAALASVVLSDGGTHESVRLLFNLAVNDFRDR